MADHPEEGEYKDVPTKYPNSTRCLHCQKPIPTGSLCHECADSEVGDDWADTVLNSQDHGFPNPC
jgi:hypothetical protein